MRYILHEGKTSIVVSIVFALVITCSLFILNGCGSSKVSSDVNEGESVSGGVVSMSAVGEQALVDDPAPEYVDAKMNVNIDSKNETVIPNPMEPMSEYKIKLKCEYDREDANGEYSSEKDEDGVLFSADMSFAGLPSPVWIESVSVGSVVEKSDKVFTYHFSKGKKKKYKGNCLIVVGEAGANLSAETEEEKYADMKEYLIVLDYENHKVYKSEIRIDSYPDNSQDVSVEIGDITGNGRDDILINRGSKSSEHQVWIYDDALGLTQIFDDEKNASDTPSENVKIDLLDNYKMRVSCPACDWEETISLVKDCGIDVKYLDKSKHKRSVTGDLYDDELQKWKEGKYIGNRDEFSCYPYFAMEYNEAHFGKNNDGKLALVFNDFIALCHRDSVGDFITYMKYDEQQKKMVIDDVEFNPVDYDFVG